VIERRTLVSGAVLGLLLLGGLTLAGVLGAHRTPHRSAPPPDPQTGTRIASQPELEQALLRPADLPKPYAASSSKATVRRLPPTERCAMLLEPKSLVRDASARVLPEPEATDQASTQLDGPARLVQLLTTYAGDGAAATLRELRQVGRECHDFNAVLDDGTAVRVSAAPVRDDANGYTLKLTLTGSGRTTSGYLTLGTAGQVLSVLSQLGTAEAVSALDPVKLVNLTLSRLTQPG
jgi:hypothetical protein